MTNKKPSNPGPGRGLTHPCIILSALPSELSSYPPGNSKKGGGNEQIYMRI
jgi:hypothetical protein